MVDQRGNFVSWQAILEIACTQMPDRSDISL
jgi:hypothetical protein